MKRRFLRVLIVMTLIPWIGALLLLRADLSAPTPLPTLFVLPSLTPSFTPSVTPTATPTLVPPTLTATVTPSATWTPSPTLTPTLATRVLQMSAVMPGVYVPPTTTPFPPGTILLPAPPQPFEPLPNATYQPPPYEGWYSFESDHPNVRYATAWEPRLHVDASQGQYHRTENMGNSLSFAFEGEGLRIRYIAASNMGMFQVIVDGVIIDTVDAYAPEIAFVGTRVYTLSPGFHVLEIRSAGEKNSASEGYVLSLDAVQVFRGSANTLILTPPSQTSTPTPVPQPAAGIELIAAPPTIQPTATPIPPRLITVSVVIAYDENGNRSVDPAEGVRGISVRVVEVGTNRVITQAFTDAGGYAQLQVLAPSPARVVVPYFGKFWEINSGRDGGNLRFTLLLTPGNQPGLIP